MKHRELISVVVPIYNETEVIEAFYDRITTVLESLNSFSYEIIFIDDGSHDNSYKKLIGLANSDSNIRLIKFSRNFGHQIAITAGLDIAGGDAVVVIDADLQDPPEIIITFIEKWEEGYDVVYGIRKKREAEGKMKLLTAGFFYRLLKRITAIDIPVDVGDFRLMSRRAVDNLQKLREQDRFVRGLVSWIGFRQIGVYYTREQRFAGKTKYPFRKMLRFALDGITSFSTIPLKAATILGYFTSLLAFLYACSVFIQKALGITVQGWATIMVGMLFIGGVQLICIGIIGEYIARIFNETKQRPLYIVEETYTSADAKAQSTAFAKSLP
jgi:dolichol-phosphate mannosyltransferase